MRRIRRPELFTGFGGKGCVVCLECYLPDSATFLFLGQALDDSRKMIFVHTLSRPWREISHLSEITIIAKIELWSDGEDLTVECDESCIIAASSVLNGQTEINDDILAFGVCNDLRDNVPRIVVDIIFKPVIEESVTRYAELWSQKKSCSSLFGSLDCFNNPVTEKHTVSHNPAAAEGKWSMMLLPIAIIIKRPLIELTGSQHTFPRHFGCWY
jgi:hypothetical protein